MAVAAMSNRKSIAEKVAKKLGIKKARLYYYVNGDGSCKEAGGKLLEGEK
ncbi:resolvase domain-containing protein [endosymbiont of Acanthamoeba sp. UWC8]|nr:hypothetical protein [endosymbiont of Acanthamoeba sp. UWC8]AIF81833.1 resolvase domain-containing protein [endosymbiont of Acanthamoeba sp. UWC8]